MQITQKPTEQIMDEVTEWAAESFRDPMQRDIAQNLGAIALGQPNDALEEADRPDFVDWLRDTRRESGETAARLDYREAKREKFAELEPLIDRFADATQDGTLQGHGFIATGSECNVYRATLPGEGQVALKFATYHRPRSEIKQPKHFGVLNPKLEAYRRTEDLPGVEKLVAYSPTKQVMVTTFENGVSLGGRQVDMLAQVPPEAWSELLHKSQVLRERGIQIDDDLGNYIFDPANPDRIMPIDLTVLVDQHDRTPKSIRQQRDVLIKSVNDQFDQFKYSKSDPLRKAALANLRAAQV